MNTTTDHRDSSDHTLKKDQPNTTHPLYGLTAEARIESRQRVLAKALAEILLANRRQSNRLAATDSVR